MTAVTFGVSGQGTMGRNLASINLLLDPAIGDAVESAQGGWRRTIGRTAASGIPVPAHSSALAYFDSYRTARLPQSLTQAQRDAFGAHTYEPTTVLGPCTLSGNRATEKNEDSQTEERSKRRRNGEEGHGRHSVLAPVLSLQHPPAAGARAAGLRVPSGISPCLLG